MGRRSGRYGQVPGDVAWIAQQFKSIRSLANEALRVARHTSPGIIRLYAGTTIPNGWLECDGSSKSRTEYARLFDVIGTTFGSTHSSNFNVPNITPPTSTVYLIKT